MMVELWFVHLVDYLRVEPGYLVQVVKFCMGVVKLAATKQSGYDL